MCIKTRSPPASLQLKGQVTEHTTVKWAIADIQRFSPINLRVLLFSLLVNDPTVDWTVRHGHAIALSAVLHDAVERIVSQGLYQAITDAAVIHATTDRVSGYLVVVVLRGP